MPRGRPRKSVVSPTEPSFSACFEVNGEKYIRTGDDLESTLDQFDKDSMLEIKNKLFKTPTHLTIVKGDEAHEWKLTGYQARRFLNSRIYRSLTAKRFMTLHG